MIIIQYIHVFNFSNILILSYLFVKDRIKISIITKFREIIIKRLMKYLIKSDNYILREFFISNILSYRILNIAFDKKLKCRMKN